MPFFALFNFFTDFIIFYLHTGNERNILRVRLFLQNVTELKAECDSCFRDIVTE